MRFYSSLENLLVRLVAQVMEMEHCSNQQIKDSAKKFVKEKKIKGTVFQNSYLLEYLKFKYQGIANFLEMDSEIPGYTTHKQFEFWAAVRNVIAHTGASVPKEEARYLQLRFPDLFHSYLEIKELLLEQFLVLNSKITIGNIENLFSNLGYNLCLFISKA